MEAVSSDFKMNSNEKWIYNLVSLLIILHLLCSSAYFIIN